MIVDSYDDDDDDDDDDAVPGRTKWSMETPTVYVWRQSKTERSARIQLSLIHI